MVVGEAAVPQPERDATVEPAAGQGLAAPQDQTDEKRGRASFLAQGRYDLSDEDIMSRANVRHLMARSDLLDEVQEKLEAERERSAVLDKELSVLKARTERQAGYDNFITFCNSAGFAATGYAISFLTSGPGDKRLDYVWTILGLIIAGGSLIAQLKIRR
jgi:hypothetical protein